MRLFVSIALAVAFASSAALQTDYTRERSLHISTELLYELETSSSEMLRDGEPVESRFGSDWSLELSRRSEHVDRVLEHSDGRPLRVQRSFEELEGSSTMQFADDYRESEADCPLAGVTLEIEVDEDGEVEVTVVEGDEPDDERLLEGHVPTLALDALLPEGELEAGESWDLEQDAILTALGFEAARALFPAPRREDRGGERGGRRGGGRGDSLAPMFENMELEGSATLEEGTEEHDGLECVVLSIEIEGSGSMPEEQREGGPGRRRMPGAEASSAAWIENSHEIELEGRLLFCIEEARPLLLELDGTVHTERSFERTREDSTFSMSTTRDGILELRVVVSEQE